MVIRGPLTKPSRLQGGESGARPCGQRVPEHRLCPSSGRSPGRARGSHRGQPSPPPRFAPLPHRAARQQRWTPASSHLHGIEPTCLAAQVHLPEGAAADRLHDGELLNGGGPGDLNARRAGGCGGAGAGSIAPLPPGPLGCHGAPGPGPAAIQSGPAPSRPRRHQRQRELSREPAGTLREVPAVARLPSCAALRICP